MRVFVGVAAFALLVTGMTGCSTTSSSARGGSTSLTLDGETAHRGPTPRPLAEVSLAPLEHEEGSPGYAFVDGRTGAALSWEDVKARLASHDVVAVGETHDDVDHHALQARVVDAMGEGRPIAVALEMVPSHLQPHLDRYNAGEIDEDGMTAAVDWATCWGYDFELYRPIFEAGHKHRARFVGVNAPRELVRDLAKKGVDGLDDGQRSQLPQLDLGDSAHRAQIEEVFTHHHPPTSGGAFDRFYSAQVLWDESMADGAARALDSAEAVVVIAGNGHVAGYRGIPNRLLRRKPQAKLMTIVPVRIGDDEDPAATIKAAIASGEADVLAVIRPRDVLSI
jgi:uncharacterized iron-regulated protein